MDVRFMPVLRRAAFPFLKWSLPSEVRIGRDTRSSPWTLKRLCRLGVHTLPSPLRRWSLHHVCLVVGLSCDLLECIVRCANHSDARISSSYG